jgi:hypothetical protein
MRMLPFVTTALALLVPTSFAMDKPAPVTADEAGEIAINAYFYAFPLVLMDVTRQVTTNCEMVDPARMRAPVNQFVHVPAFPDASFTEVVRPNADTLYSPLWYDVTAEPLVIEVPDSGGRYYLLPMLDMWTDIFASPGKRTTGTGPQMYVLVGPGWSGNLPDGATVLRSPTGMGWLLGRTQTNGKQDYENVHRFQAGLKAYPLSAWGKDFQPPHGTVNPNISHAPPVEQVLAMDAGTYFARLAELMKQNPPHANDYPILQQLERLGITVGNAFELSKATPEIQEAFRQALPVAQQRLTGGLASSGTPVNHWRLIGSPIGTYGTDYYRRALIAFGGLGANVMEDAIYPTAFTDDQGRPFDSGKKYVLHIHQKNLPPVRAFWSLTMYNDRQLFADNPIDRYAIGDRDPLKFGADGSLTLYIQRESPGPDKESNWLPAPQSGGFSMNLRLYWPKLAAIDGTWQPTAVKRTD